MRASASRIWSTSALSSTSCVVAPLWNAGSRSFGSRAWTAFTNGITGTPATAVSAPSFSRSRLPAAIASMAAANPSGARSKRASARASAASTRSMAPMRALSENTARISAVAKSGPVSAESSAEKLIAPVSHS